MKFFGPPPMVIARKLLSPPPYRNTQTIWVPLKRVTPTTQTRKFHPPGHEFLYLFLMKILIPWLKIENTKQSFKSFKVVLGGYHRIFFDVKVKTVKLIGGRRYLAVKSGLNVKTYSKSISRLLVCLQPPAANKLHFWHPKVVTTFLENGSVETNSIPLC